MITPAGRTRRPDDALSPRLEYDVVIPTSGRHLDFLHDAIASVEHQTLPPNAVIVVVDGDPQAAEVLRRSHPGVRLELLDHRSGAAVARQRGILAARSEWVAFLDDDDLWSPGKQAGLARYVAEHPECAAVRAGFWMFTGSASRAEGLNGHRVELRADSLDELEAAAAEATPLNDLDYLDIHGDSLALMLEYNRGVISTTMVRRDVLSSVRPVPAGQRPGDDYLLFCHIATVTEWHLLKERLGYYRVHDGQDTQQDWRPGENGLIRARLAAWEVCGPLTPRPLRAYGRLYRADLRSMLWQLVKFRKFAEARTAYELTRPLLPRRLDRLAALLPEPLVWHAQHALGRLRGRAPSTGPKW